ncbi:NADP-dependent oxidoreductase domain-containing protein [Ochromonadaceae sp. CCMP2298]|nr:NADP-dependent oxidoreductase domain-containing protein [Ochromonadaceae sp. CCMP2298]
MPAFMYGTAWKKERTKDLVQLAVKSGFRGIDTACQPKHYYEPGTGEALQALYAEGIVTRADIFLQTKFTSLGGQDPNNIPYDPKAPLADCVRRSFETSLQNLQTSYVDSLVMHSPMPRFSDTLAVWRVFEELHQSGRVRQLGLSNTYDLRTLTQLYEAAVVKPSVLQNRFYEDSGYDVEIRQFCKEHSIRYQSFWTLTGNPQIIKT